MKRARSQKWFEDTIFIFTADHTLQTFKKFDFQEGFQVPLLIYAPKYFKSQVNFDYSGHLDILPTVLDIIGTKGPVSLAGRSLLMNFDYRYTFLSQRYSNPAWVDSFGYVSTDLAKEIDSQLALSCDPGCKNNRVQYLNALNAYLYKSVKENSWTH